MLIASAEHLSLSREGILGLAQWALEHLKATPDIPLREIADLTPIEKLQQEIIGEYAGAGLPEAFKTALDLTTKYAKEDVDVTQLPEFKPLISRIERIGQENVNQVLRRMQRGGMAWSTPQGKAVGREFARELDGHRCDVALAIGYRDPAEDYNEKLPKSRRRHESVFVQL